MTDAQLLSALADGRDLSAVEAALLVEGIVTDRVSAVQAGVALALLRAKGETAEEILGFVKAMRSHALRMRASGAVDLAGTGGDGSGTFNVSTAASFVVAGAGARVAKHGNRAASSKCGSADVLEALGVNIALTPRQAEQVFKKTGMVFLFAPAYHPAMKVIAPIRRELGFRTVFNILGPFLNPAGTKRQLLGVPSAAIAEKLASVAAKLSYARLLLVSGEDGTDEMSTTSRTIVYQVEGKKTRRSVVSPERFGIARVKRSALAGGDAAQNAAIIRSVLAGEKGPRRDVVVLNAGAALYAAGRARTIREGVLLAERSIDSGAARKVLETLITETKKYAPET